MNRPFEVQLEQAYRRSVLFAVELLDAVTLSRVTGLATRRAGMRPGQGLIVAQGLQGAPIENSSGFFVWLDEDIGKLQKISIDPGMQPYESIEYPASQVNLPLTTIELSPRADYAFAAGITGLRGRLIEERVIPPQLPEPVRNAETRLRWLDENGDWRDAPTISHTDSKSGDFVSILRLGPTDKPDIDANGAVTTRLRVSRDGANDRISTEFKLLQGRITDPSTLNPLTFAWDELQP
jgi:hypothetical protein